MRISDAHSIRVGICDDDKCRAIHIWLVDAQDNVFASATVSVDDVPKLIEELKEFSYHIVALRGDE